MDFWSSLTIALVGFSIFLYARKGFKFLYNEIHQLRKELKQSFLIRYEFDANRECLDFVRKNKVITTIDWVKHKHGITEVSQDLRPLSKRELGVYFSVDFRKFV